MYNYELEQEFIYNNEDFIVCADLQYTVSGMDLPATALEPAESIEIEVQTMEVHAILRDVTVTFDGLPRQVRTLLSKDSELYKAVETEFTVDDCWYRLDSILEKIEEDYRARLADSDY
jgi:hypothetical protein